MPLPVGYGAGTIRTTVPNDIVKNFGTWQTPGGSIPISRMIRQQWGVDAAATWGATVAAPASASATAFVSTPVAAPNTATLNLDRRVSTTAWDGTLGATGLPDVPRSVIVTVAHGTSIVAVNGVITGVDGYGRVITETWSVTATGTSKTYTTKQAFGRVDAITVIAAADASADTVTLGTANDLGLQYPASVAKLIVEVDSGSIVTNGALVAGTGGTANTDRRGTYKPNGAPNGTKTYLIYYFSDDPTAI